MSALRFVNQYLCTAWCFITPSCLALIDITAETVNVEFLRVPYDAEKAAQAIVTSGLPEYFAEKLKEAK
jgi:hypothetical protein